MSPASQGNLEVERYIGSCLISARFSNNSSKNVSGGHNVNYKNKKVANGDGGGGMGRGGGRLPRGQPLMGCPPHSHLAAAACECARYGSPGRPAPAGWTGLPLISMAVHGRRQGPPRGAKTEDSYLRTPLSRLAIHTQGAPLILSGHCGGRKNNAGQRGAQGKQGKADGHGHGRRNAPPNSDCLSVASDESSGHSENSLPRIIKPRKRRKKDRKPPASPACETNNNPDVDSVTESSTIVTLKPYVPLCHDLYGGHRGGAHRRDKPPEEEEARASPTSEDVQSQKLPQEAAGEEDGDALLNTLFPYRCAPSVCQCRYCDPSGLIWDVDQHCYSPFLTPPSLDTTYSTSPFANIPLFLSPPPAEDLFNKDFEDSSAPLVDADHKEPVRRSWSEPSAASSAPAGLEFGVIGGGRRDVRHSDSALEVSTEIVTSLNGHRDIEIKFYSSSPPSAVVDAMNYRSGCESDENVNKWSDVWGNPCETDRANVSDATWGSSWEQTTTDSSNESSSKQLSDEVNQLCLHNAEE